MHNSGFRLNGGSCPWRKIAASTLAAVLLTGSASAKTSKGVWWWRGEDAENPSAAARRFDFLASQGVDEIYFCVDLRGRGDAVRKFVKTARSKGMRVALLAGDVSWIYPGNRGFAETLSAYTAYQRAASPDERLYALHFDVEPHQDKKLDDSRKWQLYADFVLRAAADVHASGEKVEWDIPFWLDNIRVAYGERKDAPLLEVVMDNSDGVTIMSYRDSAKAMLDVSKTELGMAASRKVRVVLSAETGKMDESENIVTFFEEGATALDSALGKVAKTLEAAHVPGGAGIAVHHLGSWEKLVSLSKGKDTKK